MTTPSRPLVTTPDGAMTDQKTEIPTDEEIDESPEAIRREARSSTRMSLLVFGVAAALMIVAAAIIHVRAWLAYEAAGPPTTPVLERLESATTAAELEPFMTAYRARLLTLANGVADDTKMRLDDRVTAARIALQAAPENRVYRVRFGYLYAQRLARDGHLAKAVDVMAATYKLDVGNQEMLAFFKRIQDELALETNRKAHLQHGHEGPGGTLKPSDIER